MTRAAVRYTKDGNDEVLCGTEEAKGAKTLLLKSLGFDMKRALAEKGSGKRKLLENLGNARILL